MAEAKINYTAEDINKLLADIPNKATQSALTEAQKLLHEQIRGIGAYSDAYYDPFIKIADYNSESEAVTGLNALDYTNTKYLGHFKLTVNGRLITGTNYPMWMAKGVVLQVIRGGIIKSSTAAGFANSSTIYSEAYRSRNENGVWSSWTFLQMPQKAVLNLGSDYETLKTTPESSELRDVDNYLNRLRLILKTLVDKLDAAGIISK